jgi:hypothetical protein
MALPNPPRLDLGDAPPRRSSPGRVRLKAKPAGYRKSDPGEMKYLLENVPRDLIHRAKEKARLQDPPVSVKWVLIKLLEQWVNGSRKI